MIDKGLVGQESTSYISTTIDTYVVDGILLYSLRVQIFAIGIVLRSKVKRNDAIKGQASFLVEVKSQSKYLAGQKFDQGR